MKDEIEIKDDSLTIALTSLSDICKDKSKIDSGHIFIDFLSKTIEALENYSRQNPSKYFSDKIRSFPKFEVDEIDVFIENKYSYNYFKRKKTDFKIFIFIINMTLRFLTVLLTHRTLMRKIFIKTVMHRTAEKFRITLDISQNLIHFIKHKDI